MVSVIVDLESSM